MRSRLCTPAASSATGALAGSGGGAPNCSPCRSITRRSGRFQPGAVARPACVQGTARQLARDARQAELPRSRKCMLTKAHMRSSRWMCFGHGMARSRTIRRSMHRCACTSCALQARAWGRTLSNSLTVTAFYRAYMLRSCAPGTHAGARSTCSRQPRAATQPVPYHAWGFKTLRTRNPCRSPE